MKQAAMAAMAGGIAEAYYGYESIPQELLDQANRLLPNKFKKILKRYDGNFNA